MEISAAKFKATCLHLMDYVNQTHEDVVVTKRGRPVARLTRVVARKPKEVFGCMRGTVTVLGDIVGPTGEVWNAER